MIFSTTIINQMITNRKEAMLECMRTGGYTPYKLPDSKLPVSGAFFFENGEIVHRDLEKALSFIS